MKSIKIMAIMVFALACLLSPGHKSFAANKGEKEITKVYYFHKNRRCQTCLAIEKQTRKVLKEETYIEAKESNTLQFKSMNSENSVNNKLVKEFGITGSGLIIIKGDEKIDLTAKAFLYARNQPEKFKTILREALE
jgi:hypothetical protein